MATNIKFLGIGMLVCWACLGCTTSTTRAVNEDTFMVNVSQQDQLERLFAEIRQQASYLPRKSVSRNEILELMVAFEADIAQILNPQQWADYQARHRQRFANHVYRDTMRKFRTGVSSGSVGTGYRVASMDF